jgi:hypothetical protein
VADEPTSPLQPAAPAPDASGAPPAPLVGEARLQAAFAADAPPEERPAAPASRADAPPADAPRPLPPLTREQKQQLLQSDPDLQEEARTYARREIDRREQQVRESQQREQQVQQQYADLQQRLETTRAARTIAADPFHPQYQEAQQWLLANTEQQERQLLQAQVVADPEFQQRLTAYTEQVSLQAKVAAVEHGVRELFPHVTAERYEAIRTDPKNDTVPKFYAALHKAEGWLSPAEAKKEVDAAREEGRRKALGTWEARDFAPDAGGGMRNGGAADPALRGEARLRAAFLADERRASRSE